MDGRGRTMTVTVPFAAIETIFLDVGNTLISIDFEIVARELGDRGFECDVADLWRAECGARPGFSRLVADGLGADLTPFQRHTLGVFNRLHALAELGADERKALALDVATTLRAAGGADAIWRAVMPRVPEALDRLRTLDIQLVAVSNSDGTVSRSLEAANLRPYFSHVIDSSIVGFEKPDPRIFLAALEQSGARPETTMHVGDL